MSMPRREPTKVVRIPVALNELITNISSVHRSGKSDVIATINNVVSREIEIRIDNMQKK